LERSHFFKKFSFWLGLVFLLVLVNRLTGGSVQGVFFSLWQRPGAYWQTRLTNLAQYTRALPNLNQILAENARGQEEKLKCLVSEAAVDKLQRENQLLRSALAIGPPPTRQLVLAKVFSVSRGPQTAVLWLNKGSADGLKSGQAVLGENNVLAGTIGTVSPHSATVWLLNDEHSKISVRIGQAAVIGNVKGGGDNPSLELITNREAVQVDDRVVTSGLDGLPAGLPVGQVSQAELRGGNLFQSVQLRPAFDPLTTSLLFVLIPQ